MKYQAEEDRDFNVVVEHIASGAPPPDLKFYTKPMLDPEQSKRIIQKFEPKIPNQRRRKE